MVYAGAVSAGLGSGTKPGRTAGAAGARGRLAGGVDPQRKVIVDLIEPARHLLDGLAGIETAGVAICRRGRVTVTGFVNVRNGPKTESPGLTSLRIVFCGMFVCVAPLGPMLDTRRGFVVTTEVILDAPSV